MSDTALSLINDPNYVPLADENGNVFFTTAANGEGIIVSSTLTNRTANTGKSQSWLRRNRSYVYPNGYPKNNR